MKRIIIAALALTGAGALALALYAVAVDIALRKDRCRADDGIHPDCSRPLGHPGDHMDPCGCTWRRSADDRARV